MGLLGLAGSEDAQVDLPGARHAIDLLAVIAKKTRGNLTMEEQRMVENSLTELRFRYIQVSETAAAPTAGGEAPTSAAEPSS